MKTLLFTSNRPYHRHWLRSIEILVDKYNFNGHVIIPSEFNDSPVWCKNGKFNYKDFDIQSTSLIVHFIPPRYNNVGQYGFDYNTLRKSLKKINPQYIYIREEFSQGIALQFLWHYRFKRQPKMIAHIDINHADKISLFSFRWPFLSRTRVKQIFLWPRLDGVTAATTKSMECGRRMGLPESVPITVNYIPVLGREDAVGEGIFLPWQKDNIFVVGFAGLISKQKGWRVLLEAAKRLPEKFKVVVVGEGEEREQLENMMKSPELFDRVCFAGYLPREKLLATYSQLDVVVLPSITTRYLVEQSPNVIAEAMACGVPVIGSDSGGIPEIIGEAGLIVPEGDAPALAAAIQRLAADKNLRRLLRTKGFERYLQHYSCEAYARSLENLFGFSPPA